MRCPALLLGLALLAGSGCGRTEPAPAEPEPARAPRWSLARQDNAPGAMHVDIRADVACRARILVFGAEKEPGLANERVVLAGETVRLWWRSEGRRAPGEGRPVSVADHQAGRTDGWVVDLNFGWQDGGVQWRYPVVGTRPGRGRALAPVDALPPVLPASLPYDTDLELCAVAIADGGSADLVLAPGASGARVKGTLDAAAGDRVVIVRLVIRLERLGT